MSVRPAKTQISLGIHAVWSESSLSARRKLGSLATHWAHSEHSDQSGRTATLLVLSCRGSFVYMLRISTITLFSFINEPGHYKTNAMTCAQRRLRPVWSETSLPAWKDLQKHTSRILMRLGECPGWSVSLRWAQRSFCWFCRALAQIISQNVGSGSKVSRAQEPQICLVDFSILTNWTSPLPILAFSGVLFHFYLISNENSVGLDLHCLPRSQKDRWAATCQNQHSECTPGEDSDQPGHPPSLINVFAVRTKKACVLSYPLSERRRLWSDWA